MRAAGVTCGPRRWARRAGRPWRARSPSEARDCRHGRLTHSWPTG